MRSQATIPPCKCGCRQPMVNARAFGRIRVYYHSDGAFDEALDDESGYKESSTVRCADCGKIRRDLIMDSENNCIKVKEQAHVQP